MGVGCREGCWPSLFPGVKGSQLLDLSPFVWEVHQDGPLDKHEAKSPPIVLGEEGGVTPTPTQRQTASKVLFHDVNCIFLTDP